MNKTSLATILAATVGVISTANAQSLIFDRGLPDSSLNNIAGSDRSNVAWGYGQTDQSNLFASGDDFVLGSTGDPSNAVWRVDTIRMWIIAGAAGDTSFNLSQRYLNAQLFVGNGAGAVSQVQSGNFTTGNSTDNSNIVISAVNYTDVGQPDYQTSSGAQAQLWQVDFTNLNLVVNPGDLVRFYAFGDAVDPASRAWFNHASNAALSGTTQDGADDRYAALTEFPNINSDVNTGGAGWDKASDINVQVFGTAVPTPSALALLGLGGLAASRRRR